MSLRVDDDDEPLEPAKGFSLRSLFAGPSPSSKADAPLLLMQEPEARDPRVALGSLPPGANTQGFLEMDIGRGFDPAGLGGAPFAGSTYGAPAPVAATGPTTAAGGRFEFNAAQRKLIERALGEVPASASLAAPAALAAPVLATPGLMSTFGQQHGPASFGTLQGPGGPAPAQRRPLCGEQCRAREQRVVELARAAEQAAGRARDAESKLAARAAELSELKRGAAVGVERAQAQAKAFMERAQAEALDVVKRAHAETGSVRAETEALSAQIRTERSVADALRDQLAQAQEEAQQVGSETASLRERLVRAEGHECAQRANCEKARQQASEASARSQDIARDYEQLSGALSGAKRELSGARLELEEHRAQWDSAERARAELAAQLDLARERAVAAQAPLKTHSAVAPGQGGWAALQLVAVSAGARQAGACAAADVAVAIEGPQWGVVSRVGAEATVVEPVVAAVVADLKERLSAGLEARGKL